VSPPRRGFLRSNSLSLAFLAIFVLALAGQAVAGQRLYNDEARTHGEAPVSLGRYLTSSRFAVETTENWQSEFLQFTLYILGTVWLIQRGSSESKKPGEEGGGSDEEEMVGPHARPDSPRWARLGGFRTAVYSNSLVLVFGGIFLASWAAQSVAGWRDYNNDQVAHHETVVSWWRYVRGPDFWDRSLQNWQSEFLAVGTMAIFAVYLRQRGSPESKPVGAPHDDTTSVD
jgi:hypothetical protein